MEEMFTERQGVDKEIDRKFMQMHRMEVVRPLLP